MQPYIQLLLFEKKSEFCGTSFPVFIFFKITITGPSSIHGFIWKMSTNSIDFLFLFLSVTLWPEESLPLCSTALAGLFPASDSLERC